MVENESAKPSAQEERKLWLEYICKLNDRRLNKTKTSGITAYAICAGMCLLFMQVLELLPTIYAEQESWQHLPLIMAMTADVVYFGTLAFFAAIIPFIQNGAPRLKTTGAENSSRQISLAIASVSAIVSCLNYYATTASSLEKVRLYLYIAASYFCLEAVGRFWQIGSSLYKSFVTDKKTLELDFPRNFNLSTYKFLFATPIIVLFIYSVIVWQTVFENTTSPLVVPAYKLSVYCVSLLALIHILYIKVLSELNAGYLLNLEQRILTEKLSPEEIRKYFVSEFIGESVVRWLKQTEDTLNEHFRDFEKATAKARDLLATIPEVDPDHAYEIVGRKDNTCGLVHSAAKRYIDYSKKSLRLIGDLEHKNAFQDEKEYLKGIMAVWRKQTDELEKNNADVCVLCKQVAAMTLGNCKKT